MDILAWEHELKRCWEFPYDWRGKMQHNDADGHTRFVYQQTCFDDLLKQADNRFNRDDYLWQYSINRWYNFKASKAIEHIFCKQKNVEAVRDEKDRLKDLFISKVPFDVKVTNVLKNFPGGIAQAKDNPALLAKAYYEQQSRGQRHHEANRLFVVVHDHKDGQHHKVKAELSFISPIISTYVENFGKNELLDVQFSNGGSASAGMIFVEKY